MPHTINLRDMFKLMVTINTGNVKLHAYHSLLLTWTVNIFFSKLFTNTLRYRFKINLHW